MFNDSKKNPMMKRLRLRLLRFELKAFNKTEVETRQFLTYYVPTDILVIVMRLRRDKKMLFELFDGNCTAFTEMWFVVT